MDYVSTGYIVDVIPATYEHGLPKQLVKSTTTSRNRPKRRADE